MVIESVNFKPLEFSLKKNICLGFTVKLVCFGVTVKKYDFIGFISIFVLSSQKKELFIGIISCISVSNSVIIFPWFSLFCVMYEKLIPDLFV